MKRLLVCVLTLFFTYGLLAQNGKSDINVFGGGEPVVRGEARILFWNTKKNKPVGEFAITYGKPEWKAEYSEAKKFDEMTKGQVWRAGKNFWTTLDTNIPLRIGGEEIAPGNYYLGVMRSKTGDSWSLVFINPQEARAKKLDAAGIKEAKIAMKAPMRFGKLDEMQKELVIRLEKDEANLRRSKLVLEWGNFQLSSVIVAQI